MKLSRSFATILTLATLLCASPAPSFADTYKIYDLDTASRSAILGITASGTVVISSLINSCGAIPGSLCYKTFTDGILVSNSSINPGLAYDNGTSCTATVSPAIGAGAIFVPRCNGSREVYGAQILSPPARNIYTGPNLSDLFAGGTLDQVFLNASGDFVFLAENFNGKSSPGSDGEIYEAIDLTTAAVPEPTSILLLSTGILAACTTLRRRLGH